MEIIGIIPARMGSSRFPGKPLKKLCGMPMIEHVYKRSAMSKKLNELYVATCDEEIFNCVESFGGKAIMTSSTHQRCTERVAEACKNINSYADIVVNIQGDEPLLFPEMIDLAIQPLIENEDIHCSNLISPIENDREWEDPNEVKVVKDLQNHAIYFSREPIPSRKKAADDFVKYKQVCIIPFRREFLLKFVTLEPTPLEMVESIDMVRILEHGYKIKLIETDVDTIGVDTPEDLEKVKQRMQEGAGSKDR